MAPILRNRMMRPSDASQLATWLVRDGVVSQMLLPTLVEVLRMLLAAEMLKGVVIEELMAIQSGWTVSSVGLSGFVVPCLVDLQLTTPRAFFLSALLKRVQSGEPTFLGPDGIAAGNNGSGNDMFAEFLMNKWDFGDAHWRAVAGMGHEAYVRHHSGYHINRVMQEDWARQPDIYLAAGYSLHATFEINDPLSDNKCGRQRNFYYANATQKSNMAPGSSVSFILNYLPPVCGFSRAEQRMLTLALDGFSDDAIAEALGLSLNTLKQVWRSVYVRMSMTRPHLFLSSGLMSNDQAEFGRRGPEKRRHVLAFLKDHPQELRPH